jgi:ABC-type transport system substrate-binding protein
MRRSTLSKPMLSVCVPFVLVLLVVLVVLASTLVATPTPTLAQEAKVQRVIFGSAGFTESNRFWTIARPEHLQYDLFLETLLDIDPKTGEYTPRLAEKWQASSDLK